MQVKLEAPQESLSDVIKLISDIRHGVNDSSYDIAIKTEELIENLIGSGKWNDAHELMEQIRLRIKKIQSSLLHEVTSINVMRHILKIIREHEGGSEIKGEGQSLQQLVWADSSSSLDYYKNVSNLKTSLLDHLTEYKYELETSAENIATQASEHIHSSEIILTVGKSRTVEQFLKNAAKKRGFQVIVVESAPSYHGHDMAVSLAKSNIQTTVIPDSAVFAMMSRVNKVIIGTHTVLANGGLRASSGVHAIALAAKHYSVPVMVLAHLYKLTPVHVSYYEQDSFNVCASPANVIPYSSGPILKQIEVYNPLFDYVPPDLVTLFISHQGGNAPSYVYRMLSELYHSEDYDI